LALIVRFFVVIFAFWLASLAAGTTLVLGAVAPAADISQGEHAAPVLWLLIFTTGTFVAAFAFVPAIVVILLSESFGWRSVVFHAIAGGGIGLLCGYTFGFIESVPDLRLDSPFGTNFELMAAAGIAAGLVYWLVAGRTAGAWRTPSTS
jgi:hypothetical protein